MKLVFMLDDDLWTIDGCSGNEYEKLITMVRNTEYSYILVTTYNTELQADNPAEIISDYSEIRCITEFLNGFGISQLAIITLTDILGFIPYFKNTPNGKMYRELVIDKSSPQPITYVEFLGVKIPTAIYNMIETVQGMQDSIGSESSWKLKRFPKDRRPYVNGALSVLGSPGQITVRTPYLAVYDFLGLLKLIKMGDIFIHNNVVYKNDEYNRLRNGYVMGMPEYTLLFKVEINHTNPMITPAMFELTDLYKKLEELVTTPEDMAVIQTFLRNRSRIVEIQ